MTRWPICSEVTSGSPVLSSSAHDAVDHALDALGIDGALAQRDLHRAHQLVAIERHALAGALDDGELAQLHALEGGEAAAAIRADAPAPNSRVVIGGSRILDLGVEIAAIGGNAFRFPLPSDGVDRESLCQRVDPAASATPRPSALRPRLGNRSSTSTISSPIPLNSATPKPRVVPAGVPRRMPDVTTVFPDRTARRSCCR